jgi:hypothetical protein
MCSALAVTAQDTTYYSVVAKGKITGGQKVWKSSPNEYHYTFQFNDRGRGDSTASVLHTNTDGLISSLQVAGVDYYKNPYAESFSIMGDSAVWTVNGERKSKKFNNDLYATNAAPAIFEVMLKWIIKQPGKRAAILPDGFVHVGDPVQKEITLNDKLFKLKLFPVYFEPSPAPSYIWMTDDMHFFAMINSWSSHIQKGYESSCEPLLALQEIAGQGYYETEVKNNSTKLAGHIAFTHANVFQSATATVQKNMTVEVVNGKITAIHSSAVKPIIKADTLIDCKGKFLMPGLWDMHGHYAKDEGPMYLAGGVTHIRDMGNEKILLTYKKQLAENKLLGPDVSYLSGFIDKEDPFQGPTGKIIKSLKEGISSIDEYHQLGYPQIKLYSAIKPEWVKPMATHIHKLGMRLCGHIPAFMTAEQAINNGYDEVTHMNFIFLNFMGDTIDTRTPARFRRVGDKAGELDLQSKKVKDFISLMKRKNIALDATLNVWQGMFDEFKGDTSSYLKPIVKWLPEEWLSSLAIKTPFGNDENKTAYKSAFSNMLKMQKLLFDNGILLVAGTDGGEANALHHELELYVQAGIPANDVLKIATYNAALDCSLQNSYGQIKQGREADFILIDGNPMKDIGTIRKVEWVIKNNRLYLPKQLLASQGWKYYY